MPSWLTTLTVSIYIYSSSRRHAFIRRIRCVCVCLGTPVDCEMMRYHQSNFFFLYYSHIALVPAIFFSLSLALLALSATHLLARHFHCPFAHLDIILKRRARATHFTTSFSHGVAHCETCYIREMYICNPIPSIYTLLYWRCLNGLHAPEIGNLSFYIYILYMPMYNM